MQYENVGNTFTNSKGCECSEIDYFIPNPKGKIKWGKTDKDLHRAMVTEKSTALYEQMRITTISSQEAITQVNTLLTSAAQICSGIKATYQAKPKLKIWNADIKVALKEKRNIWLKNGKPNDPTYHLLLQKKHTKKKFRKAVRIEVGRQKAIEKSKYNGGTIKQHGTISQVDSEKS